MLTRAARYLKRFRAVVAPPASVPPPRRWPDELRDAGTDWAAWIARRQSEQRLYAGLTDAAVERARAAHPHLAQTTIGAAERVLRHEFNLLGSGPFVPVDPDRAAAATGYRPIDWSLDPVRGVRFPRGMPIASFDLQTMKPAGADVKFPWELARCQHWPVLAQAYRLTGDVRFAGELASELEDFVTANPVGTAVNWSCTMDVALRAANWAVAFELLRAAPFDSGFWTAAYESLFDHGVFIEGHLENTYEVTSNHFLSNIVGLFYVAAAFRDLPIGARWDSQCRTWLARELEVQVLADGADYESSVPYHRLVCELFLGAARQADHSGRPFPDPFLDRLRTMADFMAAVTRPDGLLPQVGDADDGRLHIFSEYGAWQAQDARHLLGPAGCMFNRGDWLALAGETGEWESAWWGLDRSRVGRVETAPAPLGHFPDAGITVMRHARDYLLVTNGVVGTAGFGNHKHNDLLGFEYHVEGAPVIVDAGSYVYTSDPDARNLFRSTRTHNTVMVDRQEQNEFKAEWLFRMFESAAPEHLAVSDRGGVFEYRGRHTGYRRLSAPVTHERTFTWRPATRTVEIVDVFEGSGEHHLSWHFHFAPGVRAAVSESGAIDIETSRASLRLTLPAAVQPVMRAAWYSPSYGVRVPCSAAEVATTTTIEGRSTYLFRIESR
ncbi:MAG TPA: alginate lyase family protein [Vicinamibacterales bacterium]|nr:alginate lyase family protein [Vicinamibacterales bacterium]